MNKKITTLEELEGVMKGKNSALVSVEPLSGDEYFKFFTRRNSPRRSVEPEVAKKFIEKHEDNLKEIHWNKTSTTIYVLR